ncbi:oligopeptide transporter [Aspergillus ellipticus CBS 707.79]|uniref:Oligopeptide transporter n=1 Tax=Aspergillus ellipticus CBS 707.79 TaxID=1448320 RepID=A0A319DK65_9EURO|nr:oligopeptide transporter [Aspergillus ellipticus CBS 707.79]
MLTHPSPNPPAEPPAAEGESPSPDDLVQCRRVADSLPTTAWLVASVTICERLCYYGFVGPFQNYVQNSPSDPLRPGGLGLGQSKASLLVNIFLIVSYVTPMAAGIVADGYLGRFRTVLLALTLYILGIAVLFVTSIPSLLHHGAGLPGLVIAMIFMGLALGGVKASLPPMLAEQCSKIKQRIKITKSGERVIVDPDITLQYAFDMYYWCMNIGAMSRVAATFIEKDVGFWATYLMSLCAIVCGLIIFYLGRRVLIASEPQGSPLLPAIQALLVAIRHGFRMDAARPEAVLSRDGKTVTWSNGLIDELKSALFACRAFTPFIIFWLCQAQMTTNTVSQAAQMETHGIPNDMLPVINSVTVVIALPLVNKFVYPALHRRGISTPPLRRVALGFLLEALGMAYAAGIQGWIYSVGPCYQHPRECPASMGGSIPNHINVGYQSPVYLLEGLSEVFASPAGYEYTFTKAPKSMKSIIQAMYGLTAAGGSLIALALTPTNKNPDLLGMYAGIAGAMFVAAVVVMAVSYRFEGKTMKVS